MTTLYEETPTPRSAWWRNHAQKLVALFIWALLLGGYSLYYQRQGLTLESSLQQLLALFATPYGPLLYLASFLIRPLLFFSVGILCIMGGIIFGVGGAGHLLLALGYTVVGVMASALWHRAFLRWRTDWAGGCGDRSSGATLRYSVAPQWFSNCPNHALNPPAL